MALDRQTSGRGAPKGGKPGSSGRTNGTQPARSDRTPKPAVRRAPPGESGETAWQKNMKTYMFYGSGAAVLLLIILLIAKGGDLFGPEQKQPERVVIDEKDKLNALKKLGENAMKRFHEADNASGAEKVRIIREAMDMNGDATEKVGAMSNDPKYQGDDYNGVFGPILDALAREHKIMGDEWAKARAHSGD